MACPGDNTVADFVARRLDDDAMDVAMHAHDCESCRMRIAAILRASLDDTVADALDGPGELAPGTIVDRFVIDAPLGSGGMGVVYSARDPQLDRKVAVKLMRRGVAATSGEPAARLLREAQAMARLTHPNVLGVYQAGVHDGHVYLAMEHIDGGTLFAWLREEPRGWREIVARFVAAGRGLAAAHDAELVHRDFKPSNVMCSRDGRVLVTDFGLVRAAGEPNERTPGSPDSALDSQLTQAGTVLGTPRYMAPEHRAGSADARSDQYSFCVALAEALYGKAPPAPPTTERRVPARIRRVITRGLAADPDARYPTMHALLADLERSPRRARWLAGGGGVLAAGAVAAVFALRPGAEPACPLAEARLAGVWDLPRKLVIEARFAASGAPEHADAWRSAEHALDRWVNDWITMRVEVCDARPPQDLRMTCLDQRWAEVRELSEIYAHADASVVHKAIQAARALTPVEVCADVVRLRSESAGEPRDRDEIDRLRRELARATALDLAGRYRDGIAIAQPVASRAKQLGSRPLEAEALLLFGQLEADAGDAKAAEVSFRAAALAAEAGHQDRIVADAAIRMIPLVGDTLGRADDGVAWADRASAAIERLGGDDAREAKRLRGLGAVYAKRGQAHDAKRTLARALELTARTQPADSIDVADAHQALAIATYGDDPAAGARELDTARAILERVLGDKHPRVALLLANTGVFAAQRGDLATARTSLEQAIAIGEPALGANHPDVAWMRDTLGVVYLRDRQPAKATPMFRRVLEIEQAALGADDPGIVLTLVNLGSALDLEGAAAEAEALHRRALAICAAKLAPDHPHTIAASLSYAQMLLRQKRWADALAGFEKLLATADATLGPERADVLSGIGYAQLELHRPAAAISPLERALRLRDAHPGDDGDLGETRLALAKALWDTDRDRPRARELARAARTAFANAGPRANADVAQTDTWLATH